jgi:hypothetical protein
MRSSTGTAALVGGLLAAAGCGDECIDGTTRCMNNVLQQCSNGSLVGGKPTWQRIVACPPPSICFAPAGGGAACVLSTDPDPLCVGRSYCNGDTLVRCAEGYRVDMQPCGSDRLISLDTTFTKCVAADARDAVCVPPEAMPNDACVPDGTFIAVAATPMCAGNLQITCLAGLAVTTEACASCTQGCYGWLGDNCASGSACAAGLTCHPDSTGTGRCTATCDPADPNAVQQCKDLFVAGGPPPSLLNSPANSRMTCTGGFCAWMDCGTTGCS